MLNVWHQNKNPMGKKTKSDVSCVYWLAWGIFGDAGDLPMGFMFTLFWLFLGDISKLSRGLTFFTICFL